MDCEVLAQIQRYMEPEIWDTSDASMAVDTIAEVGPNGHFFGVQHTQDRYTIAFWQPALSDWKTMRPGKRRAASGRRNGRMCCTKPS